MQTAHAYNYKLKMRVPTTSKAFSLSSFSGANEPVYLSVTFSADAGMEGVGSCLESS